MSSERARDDVTGVDAEFFETMAAESPDAVVSVNAEGTIVYANGSVERVFGYAPGEVAGRSIGLLLPERHHEDFRKRGERYLETGERTVNRNGLELVGRRADGEEVPLSVTIVEHAADGEPVFSAVVREIGDRLRREERLVEERDSLREAAGEARETIEAGLADAEAALAALDADEGALAELRAAHERIREATAALPGDADGGPVEREVVGVSDVAMDAWTTAGVEDATLHIEDDPGRLRTDADRLRRLLAATFAWLGGSAATVRVGGLDDGFYAAVDADAGDPPASVEELADAPGWDVSIERDEEGLRVAVVDEN